jgi:hypothetical protein
MDARIAPKPARGLGRAGFRNRPTGAIERFPPGIEQERYGGKRDGGSKRCRLLEPEDVCTEEVEQHVANESEATQWALTDILDGASNTIGAELGERPESQLPAHQRAGLRGLAGSQGKKCQWSQRCPCPIHRGDNGGQSFSVNLE